MNSVQKVAVITGASQGIGAGLVTAYRNPRWRDAMNDQDKQNWHQAEARHAVAEDFVRLLALPYAEHPDMPKDPSQPEG